MFEGRSHFLFEKLLVVGIAAVLFCLPVFGQDDTDTDPNSPTPILLSADNSTRVFAFPATRSGKLRSGKVVRESFAPGSKIVIYVTNLDLMRGEKENAFRVYTEDAKGRQYRFPVLDMQQVPGREWVYALTVKLSDEIGFWEQPSPEDLLIYVTWRGLASNTLKLGFGATGGNLRESERTNAAPASKFFAKPPVAEDVPTDDFVGYRFSGERLRFLEQTTFGPTVALDQRIRRIGLRTWLAEQLDMQYPSASNPYPVIPPQPSNAPLTCNGSQNATSTPVDPPDVPATCFRDTYGMYTPQRWFFTEAFYGEPQLRHRVTWSLSQLWVISGAGGTTQQSSHMINYNQILAQHAFGNFRNLMRDVTLSPGMGNYLDMARSTRNNPNENYAREILQLFAVGLFELNQDGTLRLDANNEPIPTYTQDTVNNFTRVFTGWTFCNTQGATCPNFVLGTQKYRDPMVISNTNIHDIAAKTLFNYPGAPNPSIPACTPSPCSAAAIQTYAANSLTQALDNIFNHPNVGPFVSKIMIQHLVTSDPTPAYVGRVAARFNNNGFGVRGDMRAVVRAILLDPEARGDIKTDPNYGKLREPVQLLTNMARQIGVRGAGTNPLSDGVVNASTSGIGQSTFNSPTVFNFYPPDYVVPGTAMLGPEFALMTTGTSIGRANLANTYVFASITVSNPDRPLGTSLDFAELQSISTADATSNQLLDVLNQRMLHGTMTAGMRSSIITAVNAIPANNPSQRARQAAYLVATSAQFQVQR